MKRKIALLLTLTMAASLYGCGSAAETSEKSVEETQAATVETTEDSSAEVASEENGNLAAIEGTYVQLFPEFAKDEYKDWWVECINAYETDEDKVESYYKMLTETYMGTVTGQEAVEKYTGDSFLFDCFFENDIETITIDGNTISGADADGNEVFSHEYAYVEDMDAEHGDSVLEDYFHIYKTEDADAGQFTYFAFTDDTPAGEYHIEFRYGDNLDDLGSFMDGDYAYWMASGITKDYDEEMIHNCIKLFVDENVGGAE